MLGDKCRMWKIDSETSKASTNCKSSPRDGFEQFHNNTYHSVITVTGSLSKQAPTRPIGLLVMGLRVSLHEGDKVLWDLPLEEKDWEDGRKRPCVESSGTWIRTWTFS